MQHGFGGVHYVYVDSNIESHENPLMFVSQCRHTCWDVGALLHCTLCCHGKTPHHAAVARGLLTVAVTHFEIILNLWNQLPPICNLYVLFIYLIWFFTLFWSLCGLTLWSKYCKSVYVRSPILSFQIACYVI